MAVLPSDHDIILALGEDLPVGLWVARAPGGEEVYANRMFAQIMGTPAVGDVQVGGYAQPYGIRTRSGEPYPEDRMPFVRALVERRVVEVDDLTIHRRDGHQVHVRAFARPVGDPITHVIIAFFDITREVEAERAHAETERRLQAAQRLEAIGNLAGGIAHDFNNLIFGIKLIAADLAASEREPKRRAALQLIDDITDRSASLTRSLLTFARRGRHHAEPIGLNDVVAAMSELLRRTLSGVALEFELDAGDRGTVVGDQGQLEQVVMNLVVNARDAVDGTGRIVVRTTTVDAEPGSRWVVLEVADDGPGIPPELRDRVFEPYFTTKTHGPEHGTGLGLATVFGIVESHGGTIEVAPGLDARGTTMRVRLPAAPLPADAPRAPWIAERPSGIGTVLIVDDDALVRGALASAVEQLGYGVVQAASGAEGIARYVEHRREITAVLLDLIMPGMGGRAVYLALRELDPEIRVIVMSGYTLNEDVRQLLDLGVKTFLSKPYSIEILASTLAQVTSSARGA